MIFIVIILHIPVFCIFFSFFFIFILLFNTETIQGSLIERGYFFYHFCHFVDSSSDYRKARDIKLTVA